MIDSEKVRQILKDGIAKFEYKPVLEEVGRVISYTDGVTQIYGLDNCMNGELLDFGDGIFGMAMDLNIDTVGAVLLSNSPVAEGTVVKRTGRVVSVPVGDSLLGRVINPLGEALDGRGDIEHGKMRPIENPAPDILDRQPVDTPLETGILTIDSLIPIGKGQRELIIGDRQTGKTAIAIDTILNQRNKDVYCVYVAIGQKVSSVASIVNTLREFGAMDYTVVVAASASDSAAMQYIAPYAGCAIAEEWMYSGKNVLVVYDDLSKHAVAYRAVSLLLRRPPGREAYPGDVFYLHSRLLERAARLSDKLGGGSMTALPIVETLEGDVAAYIPTNVISITDGQIYLITDLFFKGMRPAVDVGLSVSRVGGAAQIKAMKKVVGSLRLNLAQYNEMQVFAQFGSELDKSTRELLDLGDRIMEVLKQDQYKPYTMFDEVVSIYAVTNGYFKDVDVDKVREVKDGLLNHLHVNHKDLIDDMMEIKDITEDIKSRLDGAIKEYLNEGNSHV
ncbi:MAG: F0F1 ATP synthase subunit alpha [Thermoanaerobacteraceae bacterium]|nr:F0F1 ATP synthase subunit alpha [Thermoanaerobacteraceae bacterium]